MALLQKGSRLSPETEQLLTKINDTKFIMTLYENLGDTEKVKEIAERHYQKTLSTDPALALSFAEEHKLGDKKCREAALRAFHVIMKLDSIALYNLVTAYGIARKYNLQGDIVTALNQLVELNRDYLRKYYKNLTKFL